MVITNLMNSRLALKHYENKVEYFYLTLLAKQGLQRSTHNEFSNYIHLFEV